MATELGELYGEPMTEELPSFWQQFEQSVIKYPENIALASTHQAANLFSLQSEPLNNEKTLYSAVDSMTISLQNLGIKKNTPLVTFFQNDTEYVITMLAACRIGCTIAPINPRNVENEQEVIHMITAVRSVSPDHPIVFVVGSAALALQVDSLNGLRSDIKIVVAPVAPKGWISFEELMKRKSDSSMPLTGGCPDDRVADVILFTSGTTALPKGCIWTSDVFSTFIKLRLANTDAIKSGDKVCIVVPNNHALGCVLLACSLVTAATAIYPGPTFAPDALLSAMRLERCTHTAIVPTMIYALLAVGANKEFMTDHLINVVVSGASVTPEVLDLCRHGLGTAGVENAYGMTEGVLVCTGNQRDPSTILSGNDVAAGWIAPGTAAKICAAGEKTALPRGQAGELHFSGRTLCNGYIGIEKPEFYVENGKSWIMTGDQAIIDDQGRIFLVGRYKDMIIRGAENISPAAIEAALGKIPYLAALQIQIVGAPDHIAGEVPVAVVHGEVTPEISMNIRDAIIDSMGTIYAPDEIMSLASLGLKELPRTMSGKIQKNKIAAAVRQNYLVRKKVSSNGTHGYLQNIVKDIWARAVGREPDQLSLDDQISDFADSITVIRVRDRIMRETGKTLSLSEMAGAGTLGAQIKLLESATIDAKTSVPKQRVVREGPPEIEDMAHLIEEPELYDATKDLVERTISPFGFAWDDVAEVLPAYDFATVLSNTHIFDSWNFKMALLPKKVNSRELRKALDTMLRINPMLSSFLVWDEKTLESDLGLHITIKHSEKLLDQVIEHGGTLKTLNDLKALTLKYPQPTHATFPGLLYRAIIYDIEETGGSALLHNVNHAVIDASYAQIFLEDFDRALSGSDKVHEHMDYKLWADSYSGLRSSPAAKAATKWHVRRLRGLGIHQKAIFPPIPKRAAWNPFLEAEEEDGFQHSFEVSDLPVLRKTYRDITAPIAAKAAWALLNVHRTKHTHALFANLEAARTTFPFVPKAMEAQFEATDVAGPTIQSVINLIKVNPQETVIAFLHRMQEDQTNLTKHASAPWKEIMAALGPDAGKLLSIVTQAQIFNWVPEMGTTGTNPFSHFEILKAVVRPEVGLAVNAGLGGKESGTMFLHIRGDGLDFRALQEIAYDLEKIIRWIVAPDHWNKAVDGYLQSLTVS
ncbi:acetyl-CoA synthetase-like protein [Tothia fuscella]|uniref:Acetyl-CoA synthetase-like protein n=1 Tax=Tothia fuscella TaxID=1048955 RepID=A0A9P4U2P1_9PEZI|nr:acetyl-CoA synthetase-like protein [Tothia fuscella]